jgi:hypothetical protein
MNTKEVINKTRKKFWLKWSIAFRIMPLVIFIGVLKLAAHLFSFELMELNALFTSLVAGTIFLIGFLISGVLTDYKESEKIPSELSSSLKTLFDDAYTVYKSKNSAAALELIKYQKIFISSLFDWLYKKERTSSVLRQIGNLNDFFIEMEKEGIQANYIIKMKNEQVNIRKIILRIDTIRDTEFVGSAYTIVETMGFLIAIGLVIIKIEPFYASLFFTMVVTFLISYMFYLIKDLDNPFDYSVNGESGTEISLKPIHDLELALQDFTVEELNSK